MARLNDPPPTPAEATALERAVLAELRDRAFEGDRCTVYIGATPDPGEPQALDWFEGRKGRPKHLGRTR